jgi:O-antigen ligase
MGRSFVGCYDKIIDWGFLVLLLFLPLIISPWNYSVFALPQTVFLRLSTLLIVAAWLLKMVRAGEFAISRSPLNLPLLAFFVAAAMSVLFSPYRAVSLYGRIEEYQGFLSLANYVLISFLALNLIRKERLSVMIGALLLSTSVMALYGIFQHYGVDFMSLKAPDRRSWATLGNPIFLGGHLTLVLPLSVSYLIHAVRIRFLRWLSVITVMLSLPALVFTLTRAAWLGFGIGLILLVAFSWREIFRQRQILLWLGIPLFASLLMILIAARVDSSFSLSERALSIFSFSEEGGRLGLWASVLPLLIIRPIFGWGPGTFHVLSSLGGSGGTHNELLNAGATLGIFGVVAYLTIIGVFFAVVIKAQLKTDNSISRVSSLGLIAGCLAYLVHLQFSFSFSTTNLLFWLLVGFAVGPALGGKGTSPEFVFKVRMNSPAARRVFAGAAILGAVLLAIFFSKPLIADLHFRQALDFEGRGNLERALEEYRQTVGWNSQDEFYLTMFGRACLAQAGQSTDLRDYYIGNAIGVSRKALDLNPNSIDAHLNLGIAYAYGGLPRRAVAEWKKVVSFKADHPDAYRFLGRAYEAMGESKAARENYRKVLNLDPGNAEAKEALSRLGE